MKKLIFLLFAVFSMAIDKATSQNFDKIVNVNEAGTLSRFFDITGGELDSIDYLKITGKLNQSDLYFLGTWAGYVGRPQWPHLLDISECKIVRDETVFDVTEDGHYIWLTKDDVFPYTCFAGWYGSQIKLPPTLKRIEARSLGACREGEASYNLPKSVEYIHPDNPICHIEIEEGSPFRIIRRYKYDSWRNDGDYFLCKGNELISFASYPSYSPYDTYNDTLKVEIPEDITSIGDACFAYTDEENYDYPYGYGDIVYTNTWIDYYDYYGKLHLIESIKLPEGLKKIGKHSFYCCSLKEIELPSSLDSIGEETICSDSLKSITIPKSVTAIGDRMVYGCPNLSSIVIEEGNPHYDSRNNCNAIIETATNRLIAGCKASTIPDGITSIAPKTFVSSGLKSITIPASVVSIGDSAFYADYSDEELSIKFESKKPIDTSRRIFEGQKIKLYVPKGSKAAYQSMYYWIKPKQIIEYSDPRFDITLTGSYTTFCSTADLDFTDMAGLKAYVVTGYSPSTGKVTLTRVTKVPAGTGLVLKGTAGDEYTIPKASETDILSNLLVGTTEDIELPPTDGKRTNFILANDEEKGIGFYAVSSTGTLKAGKAYLQLPTSALPAARKISFDFIDDTTGIEGVTPSETTDNRVFNLRGQRISAPIKGIYIKNNKKIVK